MELPAVSCGDCVRSDWVWVEVKLELELVLLVPKLDDLDGLPLTDLTIWSLDQNSGLSL